MAETNPVLPLILLSPGPELDSGTQEIRLKHSLEPVFFISHTIKQRSYIQWLERVVVDMRRERSQKEEQHKSFWESIRRKKLRHVVQSLSHVQLFCDLLACSLTGSSEHAILQARILEWVAISFSNASVQAKSLKSCPTLCDPMDSSPQSSSVHGILEAAILESS